MLNKKPNSMFTLLQNYSNCLPDLILVLCVFSMELHMRSRIEVGVFNFMEMHSN